MVDGIVPDDPPVPAPCDQGFARHHLPACLPEHHQHLHRPRLDGEAQVAERNPANGRIHTDRPERERQLVGQHHAFLCHGRSL